MTLMNAAVAVLLCGLMTGCDAITGTGCSDVGWQSHLTIRLDPAVARTATTLDLVVCQEDRCGAVTVPERGKGRPTYVGLAELGVDFDDDQATVLTLEVRSKDGTVLAVHEETFEFDKWYPDGPRCPSWLRHRVNQGA